jgi:ubiquitin-protein ligase
LMRDFKRLQQDPPQGVNGSPNPDNIMLWNAVIFGPEDTPWDGGGCCRRAPSSTSLPPRGPLAGRPLIAALAHPQAPSGSRSSSPRTTRTRRPSSSSSPPCSTRTVRVCGHPRSTCPLCPCSTDLPADAPPPVVPAVYADGGICLDILQNQWSPIYDVSAILTSIQVTSCCCLPRQPRPAQPQATALQQSHPLPGHDAAACCCRSRCSATPTPTRLPTQRRPGCTTRIGAPLCLARGAAHAPPLHTSPAAALSLSPSLWRTTTWRTQHALLQRGSTAAANRPLAPWV